MSVVGVEIHVYKFMCFETVAFIWLHKSGAVWASPHCVLSCKQKGIKVHKCEGNIWLQNDQMFLVRAYVAGWLIMACMVTL